MESTLMIFDVKEKEAGSVQPPSFPQPKSAGTGFPEHKKRFRASAFKRQRQSQLEQETKPQRAGNTETDGGDDESSARPFFDSERRKIDKENREKLAEMSPEEISQAQKDLLTSLDPSLVQMLLRRANLDERPSGSGPDPFDQPEKPPAVLPTAQPPTSSTAKSNTVETARDCAAGANVQKGEEQDEEREEKSSQKPKKSVKFATTVEDEVAESPLPDETVSATAEAAATTNTTHFPTPAALPDLDPSDPDFLATLHEKYFPNLPADPAKLAWMAPIPTPGSAADRDSPYYPGQDSLAVSQLRFDFRGRMLSPRVSRAIPTTKGLHHHGEAPEAAGYTVAELARLARSAVPAQRCIAFQTLGRILFRLGKGEWGIGEGSVGMGIFRSVSEGRVIDSLNEAASVEEGRGHRGSRAYAIEALWLYEKGGWKKELRGR